MTIKVPTLSTSGWVSEIAEKADKLLSYFFVSEASQTNLYKGSITSLPEILKKHGNDEHDLRRVAQSTLQRYFALHFESAEVTVNTRPTTEEGQYGLELEIDVTVLEAGKQHSLGMLVSTLNSSIMKIANINNMGS